MIKENSKQNKKRIIIIGGGPAGYTAALEAAANDLEVVLVEKNRLGGICLNYGCIPTKSILSSCNLIKDIKECKKFAVKAECSYEYTDLIERKDKIVDSLRANLERLIKASKITIKYGDAKIITENTVAVDKETIECDVIIIATGSKQKNIGVKGINPEEVFLEHKIDSKKEINILGAGAIGCELATIFSLLDFKVNLFEKESEILPFVDKEAAKHVRESLTGYGVNIILDYTLEKDKEYIICCGREANLPGSKIDLTMENFFIKVDEDLKTNIDTIYAIGDVNGNCLLAHWAMAEGRKVINVIQNKKNTKEFEAYPNVIFTDPKISFFGKSNPEYRSLKSYFKFNEKALTESAQEGFMKLFIDKDNLLKGGVVLGKYSPEIVNQLAFFYNKNINDLKTKMFFHPSFSEIISRVLNGL